MKSSHGFPKLGLPLLGSWDEKVVFCVQEGTPKLLNIPIVPSTAENRLPADEKFSGIPLYSMCIYIYIYTPSPSGTFF